LLWHSAAADDPKVQHADECQRNDDQDRVLDYRGQSLADPLSDHQAGFVVSYNRLVADTAAFVGGLANRCSRSTERTKSPAPRVAEPARGARHPLVVFSEGRHQCLLGVTGWRWRHCTATGAKYLCKSFVRDTKAELESEGDHGPAEDHDVEVSVPGDRVQPGASNWVKDALRCKEVRCG